MTGSANPRGVEVNVIVLRRALSIGDRMLVPQGKYEPKGCSGLLPAPG